VNTRPTSQKPPAGLAPRRNRARPAQSKAAAELSAVAAGQSYTTLIWRGGTTTARVVSAAASEDGDPAAATGEIARGGEALAGGERERPREAFGETFAFGAVGDFTGDLAGDCFCVAFEAFGCGLAGRPFFFGGIS